MGDFLLSFLQISIDIEIIIDYNESAIREKPLPKLAGVNFLHKISINSVCKTTELKTIFWDMHDISYEVKEEISEDPLEKETKTILYIKINQFFLLQLLFLMPQLLSC